MFPDKYSIKSIYIAHGKTLHSDYWSENGEIMLLPVNYEAEAHDAGVLLISSFLMTFLWNG